MRAPALLNMISNFTGLYTDPSIISKMRTQRECEAGRARKVPLSFTQKGNTTAARSAKAGLSAAVPALERFYEPYNKWLQQLVHPAFVWGPETHAPCRGALAVCQPRVHYNHSQRYRDWY